MLIISRDEYIRFPKQDVNSVYEYSHRGDAAGPVTHLTQVCMD